MKKRKICVVTGTRAEYGLLYWVMKSIDNDPKLELQIIATGMHLSSEFGLTYREIEKDSFTIDRNICITYSLYRCFQIPIRTMAWSSCCLKLFMLSLSADIRTSDSLILSYCFLEFSKYNTIG